MQARHAKFDHNTPKTPIKAVKKNLKNSPKRQKSTLLPDYPLTTHTPPSPKSILKTHRFPPTL